jgi:hydroxymethylpyrimidine/phosphomethylpyrimidine kinase
VLLEREAIEAMASLLPLASLITPNVHEAALLSGRAVRDRAEMEAAAAALGERGIAAVLIKGGGIPALRGADVLWSEGELLWLESPAVDTPNSHGSGCTLAAAIAAHLARGMDLAQAVREAKTYVEGGLRHSLALGSGQGPLCHWHRDIEAGGAPGPAAGGELSGGPAAPPR